MCGGEVEGGIKSRLAKHTETDSMYADGISAYNQAPLFLFDA